MANEKSKKAAKTLTERIASQDDRQRSGLVQSAIAKLAAGEVLSGPEKKATKEWEEDQLEKWGPRYAEAVPRERFLVAVDIKAKVAIEQSRRFGLTYHVDMGRGNPIDLFAYIKSWHSWAASHKAGINRLLNSELLDEVLEDGDGLDFWQRELVKERTLKERDARQNREGSLLPRELFHDFLQEFYVEPMRRRIEHLDKQETETHTQIADSLRDDIHNFEEGILNIFAESDEEQLPESKKTDT